MKLSKWEVFRSTVNWIMAILCLGAALWAAWLHRSFDIAVFLILGLGMVRAEVF